MIDIIRLKMLYYMIITIRRKYIIEKCCEVRKHIYGTIYMVNSYVDGAYTTHTETITILKLKNKGKEK